MKASFTSTEIKTFEQACKEQHSKNFEAYKNAMVQGKMVKVEKKVKKSFFSF